MRVRVRDRKGVFAGPAQCPFGPRKDRLYRVPQTHSINEFSWRIGLLIETWPLRMRLTSLIC